VRSASFVILAGVVVLAGCDTAGDQRVFRELALAPPSGFTQTDAEGTVISADPADWRVSPLYSQTSAVSVTARPAFPNPVASNGIATLILNVQTGAVVGGVTVIGYVEQPGELPDSYILDDRADARGFVDLSIVPAAHPGFVQGGGLRRIVVIDGQGEPVTYGDLMIE
jgi:hypothetical protein